MPAVQASVESICSGTGHTEYLVWLKVPAAGNDGMLLGAVESEAAAQAIANALNELLGCVHYHAPAI